MTRDISSNGGKSYLQLSLSGDLPHGQGPCNATEIRVVKLTIDSGTLGVNDFATLQTVIFDVNGTPVHIQDVVLTADGLLSNHTIYTKLRHKLDAMYAALTKPVIDLTT